MGTVNVGLMVGLDDLQGLFQPRRFCDSVTQSGKTSDPKEGILRKARRDTFGFPFFYYMVKNIIILCFLKTVALWAGYRL